MSVEVLTARPVPTSAIFEVIDSSAQEAASEISQRILPNGPAAPILYLPPILSALPKEYSDLPRKSPVEDYGPLSTESSLPSIDDASLALHQTLYQFRPLTAEYSSTPYSEAFNWSEIELPEHLEHDWYCVAFRSKRKSGSRNDSLYEADRKAHEEAVQNGGLLLYWYGVPHPDTGMNLATCIWQSRAHAADANSRPHHVRAMRLTANSYEHYELLRYILRKTMGSRHVKIIPINASQG